MCKRFTVAYGDFIGNRQVGWCLFDGKAYDFLSDKQVKSKLQQGICVNGLMLDKENNVVLDQDFAKNLMGKSGLTFKPIMGVDEDETVLVTNKYYALVKVVRSKENTEYIFITNRCGHEVIDEKQLKLMLEVLNMGGVSKGENGEIIIHKNVDIEDTTEIQPKGKEVQKAKMEGKVKDISVPKEEVNTTDKRAV